MSRKTTVLHENARLPQSRIADVDLSDSEFDDVNLRRTTFHNVALAQARLCDVDLSGVSVENANIEGMTIDGVLVTDMLRAYANRRDR